MLTGTSPQASSTAKTQRNELFAQSITGTGTKESPGQYLIRLMN